MPDFASTCVDNPHIMVSNGQSDDYCVSDESLAIGDHYTRPLRQDEMEKTNQVSPRKISYEPEYKVHKNDSLFSRLFKKKDNVFTSVFAPSEVARKSHLLVQVFLHLQDEEEKVMEIAKEADAKAERRGYIPLQCKLKRGDKVDVEYNIYGEKLLQTHRKALIWQGSFTKCSFDYFVPADLDVGELSCEVNLYVNGAMIGELRFLTEVVEQPRKLNAEIKAKTFEKIFISYAHQDAEQVKKFAAAYKAQGVDYFFDRDKLGGGDVYEEKIFEYIDHADLFILCWSANAAKSDYVWKEVSRALPHAYPQLTHNDATLKIYPISIKPRTTLPEKLKDVYNFEEI